MTADAIINMLPTLTASDLSKIKATLSFWEHAKSTKPSPRSSPPRSFNERQLADSIINCLAEHHVPIPPAAVQGVWPPPIKGWHAGEWAQAVAHIDAFLTRYELMLSRVDMKAFYNLLCACVYAYRKSGQARYVAQRLDASIAALLGSCDVPNGLRAELLASTRDACAVLSRRVPIGWKGMVDGLQQVELALDYSFPNYLQSGVLHVLVKKRSFEAQCEVSEDKEW